MFSFQLISVFLISVTFYTYIENIGFFHATWRVSCETRNLG